MLACVVCGERGAADVILNVILFVPLGTLLELKGERLVRICLAAALLSGAIELAQLFIPGRDTSPGDVLSNTTGGAVGHLIARYLPRALGLPRRAAVLASAGTAALPALVVAGTGLLLRPALPASTYYGQWTPNLGHLEWYRGRVLSAMLGGLPLPARKLVNSDTVRALLLAGAPLEVRATAGPTVPGLASLVGLVDDQQREILLLGPDRRDLVFRYRTRSTVWRLDQPDLRVPGALASLHPGDTVAITLWREQGGYCVLLNGTPVAETPHPARGRSAAVSATTRPPSGTELVLPSRGLCTEGCSRGAAASPGARWCMNSREATGRTGSTNGSSSGRWALGRCARRVSCVGRESEVSLLAEAAVDRAQAARRSLREMFAFAPWLARHEDICRGVVQRPGAGVPA